MAAKYKNNLKEELSENSEDDEEMSEDQPKQQPNNNDNQNIDCDNSPKIIPVAKLPQRLKTKNIIINVSDTQYPIVEEVAEELGWKVQTSEGIGDWDVWWTDRQINPDILYRMNLHQKINHFPGISELARKNLLALNLSSMKDKFPTHYNFFPETWSIPLQFPQFRKFFMDNQQSQNPITYIVKPEALSQGRGIFLTRNLNDILNGHKYVIQRYVDDPMLIDGLKFDLRLYVLLKSIDPLKIYIYEEGLVRLATQQYEKVSQQNMHKIFMHLTNYSLNKRNPLYQKNQVIQEPRKKQQGENGEIAQNNGEQILVQKNLNKEQIEDSEPSILSLDTEQLQQIQIGHKRSLASFWEHLSKLGYSVQQIQHLKQKINDLIVKTVISGSPALEHQYKYCQPQSPEQANMCFHILGFDVMITQSLQPMIIQINHTPSFETNSELDYKIKKNLILDTLRLMSITQKNKKKFFKKGKEINKRRLETGRREIVPDKKPGKNIVQEEILGGFTRIHPLDQNSEENKKSHEMYKMFIERARIVHKQTAETRRKMIKEMQLQEKIKSKQETCKEKCKKEKNIEKTKQDIFLPKENYKESFSNLRKIQQHHEKVASANHQRHNSFRTKMMKNPTSQPQTHILGQPQVTQISSDLNSPNILIPQTNSQLLNQGNQKKKAGNPHSWNDKDKRTQLIRFSEIMMKLVVTKQQPHTFKAIQCSIRQEHSKTNKLITAHKESQIRNNNIQNRDKNSSSKMPGNFVVPRTYQIVDEKNTRNQASSNKNIRKNREFNDLLTSIEHKQKTKVQETQPPLIGMSGFKLHNKILYKKRKRYSMI